MEKSIVLTNKVIKDLQADVIDSKLDAITRLPTVVDNLGSERSKNQLIPFLSNLIDQEPIILQQLAKQVPFLAIKMGKSGFPAILSLLENLIAVKEEIPRQQAIQSLLEILDQRNIAIYEEVMFKFVRRLQGSNFEGNRQALASISLKMYPHVNKDRQTELRNIYNRLLTQKSTTTRIRAAGALKILARVSPGDPLVCSCLETIINDQVEAVRSIAFEVLSEIVKTNYDKKATIVQQIIRPVADSRLLRLKFQMIESSKELAKGLGKESFRTIYIPYLIKFFQAVEPQLRGFSISKLKDLYCFDCIDPSDIAEKILPALKNAATDSEQSVRIALASSLLHISSDLNKHVVADQVIPKFLSLLKDEVAMVKQQLFKHITLMNKCFSQDVLMQSTLPALSDLAINANWRIRESAIEIALNFADLFDRLARDKLAKLIYEWSTDKVSVIRKRAVEAIAQLFGKKIEHQWLQNDIVLPILQFSKIKNYLHRVTSLLLIQEVYPFISPQIKKKCLAVLAELSKDAVPNIRMNVCLTIPKVGMNETTRKLLNQLSGDSDPDVAYEAQKI